MDSIYESLKDFVTKSVSDAVDASVKLKEAELEATLLKRKEVAQLLNIDVLTFGEHYRHLDGFPKELPAKRWSKLAIIKWLEKQ